MGTRSLKVVGLPPATVVGVALEAPELVFGAHRVDGVGQRVAVLPHRPNVDLNVYMGGRGKQDGSKGVLLYGTHKTHQFSSKL
jgi:hypothetical protein